MSHADTPLLTFTPDTLRTLARNYRRNLLNGLPGGRPLFLVGTQDAAQVPNLALFNSVTHVGADPALMGFLLRPLTVPRQTWANLQATGWFTLNQVHSAIYSQAHQASAAYAEGVSEFAATGLTPHWQPGLPAPFVAESHLKIGLQYEEHHEIRANGTLFVVGRVQWLQLPAAALDPDGNPNLQALETVVGSGLDGYHSPHLLARLPFARP
jgi:flavin reductase (DIM6/NTAB) family NADH-FMN oxidoreductase RutF